MNGKVSNTYAVQYYESTKIRTVKSNLIYLNLMIKNNHHEYDYLAWLLPKAIY